MCAPSGTQSLNKFYVATQTYTVRLIGGTWGKGQSGQSKGRPTLLLLLVVIEDEDHIDNGECWVLPVFVVHLHTAERVGCEAMKGKMP